jgi:hypothetical protein
LKLNIVPASRGFQWVKLGFQAFFKQPLAMVGLFFMFMAAMSIAAMLPYIGSVLAMVFLPGATLGLMAASKESLSDKFPMPAMLLVGFRSGPVGLRAMLILGALYTVGFVVVLGIASLVDGGQFAQLYLWGGKITPEMIASSEFVTAIWVAMALYLPLSALFWHAPALVHWHGVAPGKSLFFSAIACWRNLGAFTVYSVAWMGVFLAAGLVVTTAAAITGNPGLLPTLMLPVAMLVVAVFFCSIHASFADCFTTDPAPPESAPPSSNPA